jgi:hypothetical protein
MRRLPELLPCAASEATTCGESITARNARWLAQFDALPDRRGRMSRAAHQIALAEGVKPDTVRKVIGRAVKQRQPSRYGTSPRRDPLAVWH